MLTQYIQRALRHAKYELMENNRFFGSVPVCPGAWADGATLEECREELQSVLGDWIIVRLRRGLDVPVVDGIDLNSKIEYAEAN